MLRKLSIVIFALSLSLGLAACKSAQKTDESESGGGSTDLNAGDANAMGDSDSGKAMGMQTVYFKYDSFEIDAEGKTSVNTNAEIMKANPTVKIQIEGHCDQRGGIQYNIALGEKRANAVRDAMKKAGISPDRVATISYGKERLIDPSMNDTAFAKNRRGNFAITSK